MTYCQPKRIITTKKHKQQTNLVQLTLNEKKLKQTLIRKVLLAYSFKKIKRDKVLEDYMTIGINPRKFYPAVMKLSVNKNTSKF